jgi:Domain of unknown function (DUF4157)
MANSSSTATLEAPKATSTANSPVQDLQRATEPEVAQSSIMGQRVMRAIAEGSSETPPEKFSGVLGQMSETSQVEILRQLQHSYGNRYVGQVIQRKCEECEKKEIQRQGEGNLSSVPEGFEAAMQRSTGNPLDSQTRSLMEPRFGEDFKDVRVHHDRPAAEAASLIQAQAFTTGRDIYFGRGQFQPQTTAGQKLLAHELTHVVQQRSGALSSSQAKSPIGSPGDALEQEADTVANRVVQGQTIPANGITAIGQPDIQGSLLDDLQQEASDLIDAGSDFVNSLVGGGGGAPAGTGSPGGIVIPIPDIPLFARQCYNLPWSGSTGNIPFYSDVFNIPHVGPVVLTLYARGDAIANLAACLGPAILRNISVALNPLASRYSGTAQLSVPAGILAGVTLTGTIGGLAEWIGLVELGRVEGVLSATGTGGVTTELIATAEVIYDSGDISFSLGTELDTCILFTFNLDALAMASLLSHPVWSGRWSLAGWTYQYCWRLGAALSLSFTGGVPSLSVDLSAEELPVADLLPQLLGASGLLGGLTPSAAVPVTILGDSELWWFNGERPSAYPLDQALLATAGSIPGTFRWEILSGITFADFNGFPTAVGPSALLTSKAPSGSKDDVEVKVEFTGAAGETGVATKKFTVQAPNSVRFIRYDDHTDPVYVYETNIHKAPVDQFGTDLPRGVEVNEEFTAPPTADFPGMDWRRGSPGGGFIVPPNWLFDIVGGETPSHTPTPVPPTHADAGVAVYHWPGIWRIGSSSIGKGRRVEAVTWQKYRGRARHL